MSFCGYKVLNWYRGFNFSADLVLMMCHRYERLAWIPVLICYVVALGTGGKHLIDPPPAQPATATSVLSFASTIAGFVITYSPLASDFTIYFRPDVAR